MFKLDCPILPPLSFDASFRRFDFFLFSLIDVFRCIKIEMILHVILFLFLVVFVYRHISMCVCNINHVKFWNGTVCFRAYKSHRTIASIVLLIVCWLKLMKSTHNAQLTTHWECTFEWNFRKRLLFFFLLRLSFNRVQIFMWLSRPQGQ